MPIQLIAPIYETMTLDRSDERYGNDGEPTEVTIRQASQHEHERRQDLFSKLERKYSDLSPDEVTVVQNIPMEELKRLETFLTLCDCNLLDENGDPLFPSKRDRNGHPRMSLSKTQFDLAWGKLPPDVAEEIHEKVLEVNLIWRGRSGEASSKSD
jgi:hypothetical protein